MIMQDATESKSAQPDAGAEQAVAEGADAAREAVSAAAEATDHAAADTAGLAEHAGEQAADAMSQTAAAFEEAQSRLEQAGMPGAAIGRGMIDQFKAGSDRLSQRMAQDYGQSHAALVQFNAKVVESWRTNTEATIAYWQRLSTVSTWSDLVALNTDHLRQQIETMTAQARDMAELAGRTARGTAESLRKGGTAG